MLKSIKALFNALFNLINIFTGLINIGGKAITDVSEEYDAWSTRRTATKKNLQEFYAEYDTIEELMERINDVNNMDATDDVKAKLKAKLEVELKNYIED
ncbi:hypothetical protein VPHD505_0097 [Vibrio phage D505]